MMILDYTVDKLIDDVKVIAAVPTAQNLFMPDTFVKLANHQLFSKLVPFVMRFRSEYFVKSSSIKISDLKNSKFDIPKDAVGAKLRDLYIDGNQKNIPFLQREEVRNNDVLGYYFESNRVVINKADTLLPSDSIIIAYFKRPNELVVNKDAGLVTQINLSTNQVVLKSAPNWKVGQDVCCIMPEAGFDLRFESQKIMAKEGFTLTLEDISNVKVHDWIALSNQSPIPQIPVETIPLLAQMIAVKIMENMNDSRGLENAMRELKHMFDEVSQVLAPRVDSEFKKIVGGFRRGF